MLNTIYQFCSACGFIAMVAIVGSVIYDALRATVSARNARRLERRKMGNGGDDARK